MRRRRGKGRTVKGPRRGIGCTAGKAKRRHGQRARRRYFGRGRDGSVTLRSVSHFDGWAFIEEARRTGKVPWDRVFEHLSWVYEADGEAEGEMELYALAGALVRDLGMSPEAVKEKLVTDHRVSSRRLAKWLDTLKDPQFRQAALATLPAGPGGKVPGDERSATT